MITLIDKKTALVLIDLQNSIAKAPKAHPLDEVINNATKLMHAFHKSALPVIVVNVNPTGALWTTTRKDNKQAMPPIDEEALSIIPQLKTRHTDIFITKTTWNAFFETPLHHVLQQRGITNIVLGGISTSIGVEGTARAAAEHGYNITFAVDAMTDNVLSAHQNSLQYIFPRMGEVGSTDEIIALIPGAED
jgi:nicotinamidase-related amidase